MKKAIVIMLLILLVFGSVFANAAKETSKVSETKDTLVIGAAAGYTTLAPFGRHARYSLAGWAMYEKLAYEADGVMTPWLAESWAKTDDTHFTVKIYDYIYDTEGNHITSSDIVFCYNMYITNGEKYSNLIKDVKAVDDYTIAFTLSNPALGNLESVLCLVTIVSQNAYEKSADKMANQPISTSIYKVVDYEVGTYIVLERNENYWQKDESKIAPIAKARFKTLKFMDLGEASTQTINLETRTIDAFDGIDASQVKYFLEGGQYSDDFEALYCGGSTTFGIFFSGASKIMQDENLRLAIIHSIDLDAVAKAGGDLSFACQMFGISTGSDAVDYYNGKYNKYDVEKAKEYLAKSNYNGEPLGFLGMIFFPEGNIVLQNYIEKIGIKLDMNVPDGAVFGDSYKKPETYDLAFCCHETATNANLWYGLYYNANGKLAHGWVDPELSAAVLNVNKSEHHTKENMEVVSKMLDERAYGYGLYTEGKYDICAKDVCPSKPFVITRVSGYYVPLWAE